MSLNETETQSNNILQGTIIKGYSGFYYVACEGTVYECSLRGKNRKKSVKFLPGDKVTFTADGDSLKGGAIEEVLPRKNELLRPPVANLDQLVILAAVYDPLPDLRLIDRLTVFAKWNQITPVIIFNKCDLVSEDEQQKLVDVYKASGFPVYMCSTVTGQGIADIKAVLHGKMSVLAGNSGVGKTSLMNAISDKWELAPAKSVINQSEESTPHVMWSSSRWIRIL